MTERRLVWGACLAVVVTAMPLSAAAAVTWKWGPYLRFRHEYVRNMFDLADAVDSSNRDTRHYVRLKTSLWSQLDVDDQLSLYVKLTNENRAHFYFEGTSGSFPDKQASKKGYHYNLNEVFVENLYVDLKQVLSLPVDVRLGRQDFIGQYGEGFLIFDGTPVDGPRSAYFNAAKASWRVNAHNTLDVIYVNDPRTDEFLPVINRDQLTDFATRYKKDGNVLTTTDEDGTIVYWKNKALKNVNAEGYYIFKREFEENGVGNYASRKTLLNTVGTFLKCVRAPYTFRVQGASQWGSYGEKKRTGLGGYAYVDRELKEIPVWSPTATVGWLYLSGDDRKTGTQEGWDPLFSQYPWISDLYLYVLTRETGVPAYWTNLHGLRTQLVLKPTSKSKQTLGYTYLRAVEAVPATANPMFSGTSKERGHVLQSKSEYAFNDHATASVVVDCFLPGAFYANDDPALFVKTEVVVKF